MKTTAEMIAVMQGEVDGKRIRARMLQDGNWFEPCQPISWQWNQFDYEIKREPVERWANLYSNPDNDAYYESFSEAMQAAGNACMRRAVHMREVTGEDDG